MALREALSKQVIEQERASKTLQGEHVRVGSASLPLILAPSGIDRRSATTIQVGDSYIATLEVRTFPPALELGWASDAHLKLDEPGVTIHQRLEPYPDQTARRILARSEDRGLMAISQDLQAGTNVDVDAQQGTEAAAQLRREVAAGTDRMFHYAVTIHVAAPTLEELAQRVEAVRIAASQQGFELSPAIFQQWEGYIDGLPLARAALTNASDGLLHDTSGRAAAMGLPLATPGLRRRAGAQPIVYGEHPATGEAQLVDRWTLTNPHAIISGEAGSGKTYAQKGIMAQEVALGGDALLLLDPKYQEYMAFTDGLDGAYVSLSRQASYHINPLQLPTLTPERAREVALLEHDLLGQRVSVVRALLVQELKRQGSAIPPAGIALIEQAIMQAYQARGITSDPRTFRGPMPTFGDVEAQLGLLADEHPSQDLRPLARSLAQDMLLFTTGTVGALFNHQSNIPVDNPILGIDLSSILTAGGDEILERLLPIIVMDFFVTVAINRPTGRRYHLVLDEGHTLLHTEAGARTLETVYRIGRSLGFKATIITQSINDLDESDQSRVLLENSKTKLIMGVNRDSNAVTRAARLLGLNAQEARYLSSCRKVDGVGATGLLLADGERTPLLVPMWPESLHRLITGRSRTQEVRT